MSKYVFYGVDCETTGLQLQNDIIELSIYRISDSVQKTWLIKPINSEHIERSALRVNGHKLEDLLHQTKLGRELYLDAKKAIIEIENFLLEDNAPASNRCLIGHNTSFDKLMLEQLWKKCGASDSFPFGRRFIDTMNNELFFDYCSDNFSEGYSLKNLSKKYGIKNEKAHTAAADTKCTIEVFEKQVEMFKKILNK